MEKIIPEIIYNKEKLIYYKIINKNNHILISKDSEFRRKELMNNSFSVICDECKSEIILKNIPNINKLFLCNKCRNKGTRNGMYNKKHSKETKEIISLKNKGKEKSKETRLKLHYSLLGKNKNKYDGKNNPMYHKKVYDIWLNKYGKEEAEKRQHIYKNKLSLATSNKNNPMYHKKVYDIWLNKYGKEEADEKWNKYLEKLSKSSYFRTYNKQNKQNWSKISQKLFWEIYAEISNQFKKIYFGELNHEFSCGVGSKNFDFVIKDIKKVIEFNGDKFHANPNLYEADDVPLDFIGLNANDIWKKDNDKINAAKNNGYNFLIIWESDYRNNPIKEINKCLKFINEKI